MCTVIQGDLPINISWEFNHQPLTSNNEVIISYSGKRMSTLTIESVSGHHVGNYSCVGRNQAGFDVHSAALLVNGLLCFFLNISLCMVS